MTYETIRTEREGAAFVITLNRPKFRNAISTVVMDELVAAAAEADRDASISGIVITGGDSYFSAGADLNDAQALSTSPQMVRYFQKWHRTCRALEENEKPVIAAIEGFCFTGGFELALACDLRVGSASSTYAITSARIGTVAGAGGTQRLPRIVGPARAMEIMFYADPFDAKEAYRVGILNKLTEDGGALKAALSMVEHYATRAPLSLSFIKHTVHKGMQMDLSSALDYEAFIAATIYHSADRREGIDAFFEKRKAQFRGT
jgi:enoyl-CoA hydratase/carnithine racemase